MSTIPSKQRKRQDLVDPVLVFLVLILALLVLAPFTGKAYNPFGNLLPAFGSASHSSPLKSEFSFSADQRYWAANCSHGWSSDLVCDAIESRTQSCSISADSAYCSAYATYLKQYLKK